MTEELLGLEADTAALLLEEKGIRYEVVEYASAKPYEDADSVRVVRALERAGGVVELTVCRFKTKV